MEPTAAQPAPYHSEAPPPPPQTQYGPQTQYQVVVDRLGQHVFPEDRPGTWAQFSEQNAAAPEVLRGETGADPAGGYLSTWLSRDRARVLRAVAPFPHGTRRGRAGVWGGESPVR